MKSVRWVHALPTSDHRISWKVTPPVVEMLEAEFFFHRKSSMTSKQSYSLVSVKKTKTKSLYLIFSLLKSRIHFDKIISV